MRYGIVTANLGEYADPRVAVRLARAAGANVSGPLDETMARVKAGPLRSDEGLGRRKDKPSSTSRRRERGR